MLDRLTSMAVFVKVVDKGSFAAAAESLEMTPGMASKHIQSLEERIGIRLLNRTTRRHSLTDFGHRYLEIARNVLFDIDDVERSASVDRTTARGLLRVTGPVAFGVSKMSTALVDYADENPEVSIDLVLNDRVVDLVEEGFDVAIRVGPLVDSCLMARKLAEYELIVCASPSYISANGMPSDPANLASHTCLGFTHWRDKDTWTFLNQEGEECRIEVKPRLRMNNCSALRSAAVEGGGVLVQPKAAVSSMIDNGSLVRVLPDWEIPSQPMHVLWLPHSKPTYAVRSFVDFVIAKFGRHRCYPS